LKKEVDIADLSKQQQTAFNQYFEQAQQQYCELLGSDYKSKIRTFFFKKKLKK